MDKLEGVEPVSPIRSKQRSSRSSTFLQAHIRIGGRAPVLLRVRNLSAGGMMLELDPPPAVGTPIEASMRGIETVSGQVAWVKPGRAGVAFETPIDPSLARRPVRRSIDADRLMPPAKTPVRRPRIRPQS